MKTIILLEKSEKIDWEEKSEKIDWIHCVNIYICVYSVCVGFLGTVLFFGCRNRDKDFLCREEWEAAVDKGRLQIYTAFSRDQVLSWCLTCICITCLNKCASVRDQQVNNMTATLVLTFLNSFFGCLYL